MLMLMLMLMLLLMLLLMPLLWAVVWGSFLDVIQCTHQCVKKTLLWQEGQGHSNDRPGLGAKHHFNRV